MNNTKKSNRATLSILILLFVLISSFAQANLPKTKKSKSDYLVTLNTKFGEMKVILFDQTLKHKENFLKLINEKYYDSTTFHRVMNNFMIQGGDPNSKDKDPNNDGLGGPGYTITAEFNPNFFHKKGALAAARQPDGVNPNKESSGSQFYIVHGNKLNSTELNRMKSFKGIEYTEEQTKAYIEIGGTPHLDMDYTVFGEVISGLNVIDSIAAIPVSRSNRPIENVYINLSAKKMRRKKITKTYNFTYPEFE